MKGKLHFIIRAFDKQIALVVYLTIFEINSLRRAGPTSGFDIVKNDLALHRKAIVRNFKIGIDYSTLANGSAPNPFPFELCKIAFRDRCFLHLGIAHQYH